MNTKAIAFTASEQTLVKTSGADAYASNTVGYIEATFDLDTNWDGFDSVRAVWKSQYYTISAVLDAYGKCLVPAEVKYYKSKVFVNLVGSNVEDDVLVDRLTTYPVLAFTIDAEAEVEGTETTDITPSQFEQFVDQVEGYAESAAEDAQSIAESAAQIEQNAEDIADLKEDLTVVIDDLDLPYYFNEWGQGTWSQTHEWTSRNDRVSFYPDVQVEKGDVVRIYCPDGEIFARASWLYEGGTYTNVRFGNFETGFIDWVIGDGENRISVVVAKTNGTDQITPSTVNTEITIFKKRMLTPVVDSIYVNLPMSEVYEHKDVTTSGNSYELRTDLVLNRGRVKQEYIQEIPEDATYCLVTFSSEAMANGKYKIGFAFYTENYQQIASSVYGWVTSNDWMRYAPNTAYPIPSDAKYFMLYYASVDSSVEIDFSEIDFTKNKILFNTSVINYAEELLNPSVSKELKRITNEQIFDQTYIYSINHRGYSSEAPENTIPAFIMSKKKGFSYVEADVLFTSDNVPVILHDATINRTARNADGTVISNTINIADITYEQALTYDFGIWKGSEWAGTKIPTFYEFILVCKQLSLHPYIELKDETTWTVEKCKVIGDAIKAVGMNENVTFLSFSASALSRINAIFPKATLCLGCHNGAYDSTTFAEFINDAVGLMSNDNKVIASVSYDAMISTLYDMLSAAELNSIAWTINTKSQVLNLNKNVIGVLSDLLNAGKIIEENLLSTVD